MGIPVRKVKRDDVRQYLAALRARGASPETRNVYLHAIRFLFSTTLRRPGVADGIRCARTQPEVPIVLSTSDAAHVLDSIRSVTHGAMVAVLYGCGLRVS